MKFAIGQVMVTVSITNFFTGTRQVSVKAEGPIAGLMMNLEVSIVEKAQTPFIASIQFQEISHAEKSVK